MADCLKGMKTIVRSTQPSTPESWIHWSISWRVFQVKLTLWTYYGQILSQIGESGSDTCTDRGYWITVHWLLLHRGKQNKGKQDSTWMADNRLAKECMFKVCKLKFEQNDELRSFLVDTRNNSLVEGSQTNNITRTSKWVITLWRSCELCLCRDISQVYRMS